MQPFVRVGPRASSGHVMRLGAAAAAVHCLSECRGATKRTTAQRTSPIVTSMAHHAPPRGDSALLLHTVPCVAPPIVRGDLAHAWKRSHSALTV